MYSVALIDEARCIGCTKCIDACPTDAIVGAMNLMHTVIRTECIGCKLCLPPCPMDCIEMQPAAVKPFDDAVARQRVKARKARLDRERVRKEVERERKKAVLKARAQASDPSEAPRVASDAPYDPVAAALARARAKAKP